MCEAIKHTPGPWIVGSYINSPTVPDSLAVLPGDARIGTVGPAICLVSSATKVDERDEANAHLIAAAPELLTACKCALARPGLEGWQRDQIEAAIRKAEGRGQ